MTLSRRLRYEVLRRDDHTCRYCGASAPDVEITIDHVVPVSLGGLDIAENLVAACRDCNAGKSSAAADSSLVAQVSDDAVRWGKAVAHAARQRGVSWWSDELAQFDATWVGWTWGPQDDRRGFPRPADWRSSVAGWLRDGVLVGDLCEYVNVAAERTNRRYRAVDPADVWAYLCGILRNVLEQSHAEAREEFDNESAINELIDQHQRQGYFTEDGPIRGLPMLALYV